jgi:hypothetical protein
MSYPKWVKYNTMDEAMAYLPKLQEHYDATRGKNVLAACIFPAPDDGRPCLKLHDGSYSDVGTGEIVDTIEPKVEGEVI